MERERIAKRNTCQGRGMREGRGRGKACLKKGKFYMASYPGRGHIGNKNLPRIRLRTYGWAILLGQLIVDSQFNRLGENRHESED